MPYAHAVLVYLSCSDCAAVASTKQVPAAVRTEQSQRVGTTTAPTATRVSAAVTESTDELTTFIDNKISEQEDGEAAKQVVDGNIPVEPMGHFGNREADEGNRAQAGDIAVTQAAFSCDQRLQGYYADVGQQCSMFHLCFPVQQFGTGLISFQRFSFVCPDDMVFDQLRLSCVEKASLSRPCSESHRLLPVPTAAVVPREEVAGKTNERSRPTAQLREDEQMQERVQPVSQVREEVQSKGRSHLPISQVREDEQAKERSQPFTQVREDVQTQQRVQPMTQVREDVHSKERSQPITQVRETGHEAKTQERGQTVTHQQQHQQFSQEVEAEWQHSTQTQTQTSNQQFAWQSLIPAFLLP